MGKRQRAGALNLNAKVAMPLETERGCVLDQPQGVSKRKGCRVISMFTSWQSRCGWSATQPRSVQNQIPISVFALNRTTPPAFASLTILLFCARPLCQTRRMGVTPQQFEQMKNRVAGKSRPAKLPAPIFGNNASGSHEIIIGIDPSLRGTGYGVIRLGKPFPETLAHGTISCPAAWEHSRCLVKIFQTLRAVLQKHAATVCAVEGLFFAQNLQTALTMGAARGAALVAVGEAGVEIFEISPRKVKQAIVGYGAAQKFAVAKMVQRMLHLPELPAPDAADALALALAHAQSNRGFNFGGSKRI